MTKQVDANDLRELHETFIVYGNLDSPYWFVGLEGNADPASEETIDHAIRKECESAQRFREAGQLSLNDLTSSRARTTFQTTWGAYTKLMFAIERANGKERGDLWSLDQVKSYQTKWLGELHVPTELPKGCLMEMFDLSRNRRLPWPFEKLSKREGLGYLESARSYEDEVGVERANKLLKLVDTHQPRFLICFGEACKNKVWPLLEDPTETVSLDVSGNSYPVHLASRGATTVVSGWHPATPRGIPDKYWSSLGRLLANRRCSVV